MAKQVVACAAMSKTTIESGESHINFPSIGKWAKARAKDLKGLQKALEKAGDNFDGVIKEIDKTHWRGLGNRIKKLKREFPTTARFQQKVKAELAKEAKRFEKVLAIIKD